MNFFPFACLIEIMYYWKSAVLSVTLFRSSKEKIVTVKTIAESHL
jgi:hypothetical protein